MAAVASGSGWRSGVAQDAILARADRQVKVAYSFALLHDLRVVLSKVVCSDLWLQLGGFDPKNEYKVNVFEFASAQK